jgi:arabinan endo-1,5-alpha-L-arabinosidase
MRKGLVIILAAAITLSARNAPAQEKYRPVITGPYRVLFQPDRSGDTINDHTVFQDRDENWRMIGIVSRGLNLLNTPSFAHGVGPALTAPLTELPPLFADYPDRDKKWAPHVIVEQGVYHLYAGPQKIRHYTSPDGINWTFQSVVINSDWKDQRDTMVLKIAEGKWLMYITDHDNSVAVFESADLEHWTRHGRAFHAIKPAPVYGPRNDISACESPFVIFYQGYYYLSTCLTNGYRPQSYSNTVIVRSSDPYDFGVFAQGGPGQTCDYVTTLAAHAAEFIRDRDGQWYITSAGWRMFPTPPDATKGALNIAPLSWEKP